jgi:multidrug efflux pump subunit AcrA (membrane-fusion protein)
LLPGSYGELHFKPAVNVAKLTVPVNTMLFRREGPRLAVVGPDDKVQLRPIVIGRDYGSTLEILGGISVEDRIIINPADSIMEGQAVRVSNEPSGGNRS